LYIRALRMTKGTAESETIKVFGAAERILDTEKAF
jgi:hypothetical protein